MKQYAIKQKRDFVGKRNEENREFNQFERIRNRENVTEKDNNLGNFFEVATKNKIYVEGLN